MGFGDVGRDIQALQLLALGSADTAGPEQEQIGLEAEQALHVQLAVRPTDGTCASSAGRSPPSSTPTSRSAAPSSTTISDRDGARLTTRSTARPGTAASSRTASQRASAQLARDAVEVKQHQRRQRQQEQRHRFQPDKHRQRSRSRPASRQPATPCADGPPGDPGSRFFGGIEGF